MPKSLFTDRRLVAMYDILNPWGRCENFYAHLAGSKRRTVLDVGCGTGRLACHLADRGHTVTAADPSYEMRRLNAFLAAAGFLAASARAD